MTTVALKLRAKCGLEKIQPATRAAHSLRILMEDARGGFMRWPSPGTADSLLALGVFGFNQYRKRVPISPPPLQALTSRPEPASTPEAAAQGFRCDERTHGSQMTSCTEAKFFLSNCPGTRMDGNNDGVPYEQQ